MLTDRTNTDPPKGLPWVKPSAIDQLEGIDRSIENLVASDKTNKSLIREISIGEVSDAIEIKKSLTKNIFDKIRQSYIKMSTEREYIKRN